MTEEKARYGPPIIYLSGPIDYVSLEEASGWRRKATELLEDMGIVALNPVLGKDGMTPHEIVRADLDMIERSSALLVNMTREDVPHVGTSMEIMYAVERDIPVVIWGDPKSIWAQCHAVIAPELDDAVSTVAAMVIAATARTGCKDANLPPCTVYQARAAGRDYCQTEGSKHYRQGRVEPLDLLISTGAAEDFCVGNIVKYATRFRKTRNVDDIKKAVDYAHILCGMALGGQPWTRNNGTGKY
jgi:nucleoside 2-deoxyribosyltransferase